MLRQRRHRAAATDAVPGIDELVREHADAVYRVAFSIVHDRHLAEDIVQETVMKAWIALPTYRGDGSTKSWILSIAHNTAVSYLRRARDSAREPATFLDAPAVDDVERSSDARADLADLRVALASLDDLSRSIVVMRDVEQMSYQQIADTLALPLPTVKTRLLRARRELHRTVRPGALT